MNLEIEVYWIVMCKDDYILYPVAGPFCNWELAHSANENLEQPNGRCYHKIVKSKLQVEE